MFSFSNSNSNTNTISNMCVADDNESRYQLVVASRPLCIEETDVGVNVRGSNVRGNMHFGSRFDTYQCELASRHRRRCGGAEVSFLHCPYMLFDITYASPDGKGLVTERPDQFILHHYETIFEDSGFAPDVRRELKAVMDAMWRNGMNHVQNLKPLFDEGINCGSNDHFVDAYCKSVRDFFAQELKLHSPGTYARFRQTVSDMLVADEEGGKHFLFDAWIELQLIRLINPTVLSYQMHTDIYCNLIQFAFFHNLAKEFAGTAHAMFF